MKILFLSALLIISPVSFAVDVFCGDGYNIFTVVKGKGPIETQRPIAFSYPTPVIPVYLANNGLSIFHDIHCGIVSSNDINGYKGGDGRMVFSGNWTPLIKKVNRAYFDNEGSISAGMYSGDKRIEHLPPCWENHWEPNLPSCESGRILTKQITNTQKTASVLRFKKGVKVIPAGTTLFHYHLFFKLNLGNGASDPTLRTYIPVVTDKTYYLEKPTCDFSTKNVNLTLDDYEKNTNTKKLVPLTIKCNFDYDLNIKLSGITSGEDSSIFLNTATTNKAQGIGFRFTDLNGRVIKANQKNQYFSAYNQSTSLFYVDYARTNEKLRAGSAQSVINVEVEYD